MLLRNSRVITISCIGALIIYDRHYLCRLASARNWVWFLMKHFQMTTSRKRSEIWFHFVELPNVRNKAACNYCHKPVSFVGGSTGNLSRHLKTMHPAVAIFRSASARSGVSSFPSTPTFSRFSPSDSDKSSGLSPSAKVAAPPVTKEKLN